MLLNILLMLLMSVSVTHCAPLTHTPIIVVSIPKCGTWLGDKLIRLLTRKKQALYTFHGATGILRKPTAPANAGQLFTPSIAILDHCTNLNENEFIVSHLTYDESYQKLLENKNVKIIFMIRDPRDQVVSRAYYTLKNPHFFPGLMHLSIAQLISGYIGTHQTTNYEFPDLLTSHIGYAQKPTHWPFSNIKQFYDAFVPWINAKNCYCVKFEHIIGPRGGGTVTQQIQEVMNIARFLEIPTDSPMATRIAASIFGGTATFREGKIGAWRKHFTAKDTQEFKAVAGQMLIDLGYEKDLNW